MNFLEDVHEHTWIIKNFKYFLYMNFREDYRECPWRNFVPGQNSKELEQKHLKIPNDNYSKLASPGSGAEYMSVFF